MRLTHPVREGGGNLDGEAFRQCELAGDELRSEGDEQIRIVSEHCFQDVDESLPLSTIEDAARDPHTAHGGCLGQHVLDFTEILESLPGWQPSGVETTRASRCNSAEDG